MPHFREAFVAAFGMQVNDVNGGDARQLVHRDVVIADHGAQFIVEARKGPSVADSLSRGLSSEIHG